MYANCAPVGACTLFLLSMTMPGLCCHVQRAASAGGQAQTSKPLSVTSLPLEEGSESESGDFDVGMGALVHGRLKRCEDSEVGIGGS